MREFIRTIAGPLDQQTDTRPQDRRGQHRDNGGGQHPGLLLQRYLCENATGEDGNPKEKRAILQAAINAAVNPEVQALYRIAFDRWRTELDRMELTTANVLETRTRLIVGLGSESVLETGIRLHHTYGMPIIPGSALKGLAAHYCDQVWGTTDGRYKKPTPSENEAYSKYLAGKAPKPEDNFHRLLFGTTDDSGCITFHDAWYVPGSSPEPLVFDVMTPHHPRWNDVNSPVPPTDFDSPTPVPFLSVTGTFRVAVSWHGPTSDKAKNWTELTLLLLCDALRDWGVGGKTTSGYGRLTLPPPPPPPPQPKKRASGAKAKVTIIATRPKGFDVQDVEPGRNPGTLTVGTPPGTDTNPGAVVDVLVHDDKPEKPQYKWPQPPK